MDKSLSFTTLRKVNVARLPLFKNSKGELAHARPDGSDWNIDQWVQALVGEVGEYANVRKKFDRGDIDEDTFRVQASNELADVQTYLDLLAFRLGVDTGQALIDSREGFTGGTFSDLRTLTVGKMRGVSFTPEKSLCELVKQVGFLYHGYSGSGGVFTATNIAYVQITLDALAFSVGVDLGAATVVKFNNVSARIGVDIFIGAFDGPVTYD